MIVNSKFFTAFCFIIICLIAVNAVAQISLPKIIGNDMVLQRGEAVPIWGYASAGEKIMVKFNGQKKQTVADAQGNWSIKLDAMQASSTPQKMVLEGKNKIELNGILIGEVWLCSGQSNMEYAMRKNSKVTVPPGMTGWPVNELDVAHQQNIHIFLVDRKKMKPDPTHAGWAVAEDSALRSFSAVGYFFAKKLYEELHVPIGMISSAVPGSRIEPWMPREAMTALPFFQQQTDSTHKIDGEPGKFYTSMIAPLVPFALKGFLWYQGETNCFLKETIQYTYKMQALINWWRKDWNNSSMPFYYVQIAPFAYSTSPGLTEETLPAFREAQAAAMKIPHTGMAATTDLNDSLNNLHPHFKWEIGKRLALWALNKDYGKKEIVPSGPVYKSLTIIGNQAVISFDEVYGGLKSNNSKPLNCFTIAGADGKFIPAQAVIKDNAVVVSSNSIATPVAVRFGWNEADHPNLYNKAGLPAIPFQTNSTLTKQFAAQEPVEEKSQK